LSQWLGLPVEQIAWWIHPGTLGLAPYVICAGLFVAGSLLYPDAQKEA
jgi:hypothetical protein